MATCLDSRFNRLTFLPSKERMDVNTELIPIANESSQSKDEVEAFPASKKPKQDSLLDYHEPGSDSNGSSPTDSYDRVEREVSQFKAEEIENSDDPLRWWKLNQHQFPILCSLAKKFSCITATTLPCERMFSNAGTIVDNKRCSLDSNSNLDCLVFLHRNL